MMMMMMLDDECVENSNTYRKFQHKYRKFKTIIEMFRNPHYIHYWGGGGAAIRTTVHSL